MDSTRMTAIEVLLNLAKGQQVTAQEAQAALHSCCTGTDRPARIRARNHALQQAAAALGFDSPSPWVLAGRLEQAIARFETRLWPLLRAGLHRGGLSPHEAALHRAFLTGERVPGTQRRLYDLLTN